jgi:hypothetical protein
MRKYPNVIIKVSLVVNVNLTYKQTHELYNTFLFFSYKLNCIFILRSGGVFVLVTPTTSPSYLYCIFI